MKEMKTQCFPKIIRYRLSETFSIKYPADRVYPPTASGALSCEKKIAEREGAMKAKARNRYESIPKRNFRNAIVRLLEVQYKILGSHKVLQMIAEDILALHKEFYPDIEAQRLGHIIWRTTGADCKKPSYGTRVEDYEVKTVILSLVTDKDVEMRIESFYGQPKGNENYKKQQERDIEVMARLVKSAYEQGGLLSAWG